MTESSMGLKGEKYQRERRLQWVLACSAFTLLFFVSTVFAETLPQALARAQRVYSLAHSNYLASPGETEAAAALARACFELSDLLEENGRKAILAEEGINAALFVSQTKPDSAEGFFFLALNQGVLARTKSLGALSLLRQMEKALVQAAKLKPHLDHAGPDRSLGLLYLDAPNWPVSIGSRRKAREHLERAINLEPDFPDNHLSLMEANLRWKDLALDGQVLRYQKLLAEAKGKYSGPEWEQAWHDWDERWAAIRREARSE